MHLLSTSMTIKWLVLVILRNNYLVYYYIVCTDLRSSYYIIITERKDINVNEQAILSNITSRHKLK